MRFSCNHCGTTLELPPDSPVTSGPCPKCSSWIELPPLQPLNHEPPPPPARHRIRADVFTDSKYSEKSELKALAKMLFVAAIVGAIILFITYYMKRWLMT